MEHGLKYIAFYIQKHITPCTAVISSLLVHDKLLGAPAFVKRVYIKTFFPGMGIPILKIRWLQNRLIFNMGIPILIKCHLYLESPSEEDRELFVDFSSILCLWFDIQDMRTYNFFDQVPKTGVNRWTQHTEAKTKWLTFCIQFEMHFIEWKLVYFEV